MEPENHRAWSLVHWVARGKLEAKVVLPLLRQHATDVPAPFSLVELLESLASSGEPGLAPLTGHLREACRREALASRQRRLDKRQQPEETLQLLGGLPVEVPLRWRSPLPLEASLGAALLAVRDFLRVQTHATAAPETAALVQRDLQRRGLDLARQLNAQGGLLDLRLLEAARGFTTEPLPDEVAGTLTAALRQLEADSRDHAAQAVALATVPLSEDSNPEFALEAWQSRWPLCADGREQRALLDLLCCWPNAQAASCLVAHAQADWMRERAQLLLMLRFGIPSLGSWFDWQNWLAGQEEVWRRTQAALTARVHGMASLVLWLWYQNSSAPTAGALQWLQGQVEKQLQATSAGDFVARWQHLIPPAERPHFNLAREQVAAVTSPPPIIAEHVAPPSQPVAPAGRSVPPPLPVFAAQPRPVAVVPPQAPVPAAPPPPPAPSIWSEHIQPFFVENGYFLAGIAMMLTGLSVVAFYTWDKHWLVRYTIMPAVLAFFTLALAEVGQWIETRDVQFKSTAAILRGAAIGLLPVNFMAVALLSGDDQVSHKGLGMLVMAVLYAGFFGWGLRRWCAAVHPALGAVLGGTLLLLNALVMLGPLARTLGQMEGSALWTLVGVGFHAGFFLLAATVVWFVRRVLTRELAEEKRVPWFVGGTLGATFLQVFAWAHGYLHHVPRAHTYAPGMILAGALVLFVERASLQLQQESRRHIGESFLGFALVMLGLLMGAAQPEIRVLSFVLAGAVWLRQAFFREHPLHYWVALILFSLGIVAVTLLDAYPGPWRPAAGIVIALALMLGQHLAHRRDWAELAGACRGMQSAVLTLTAIVAVLAQWHYQSVPRVTGAGLLLIAALFLWRALREDQLPWVHTAMVVLAVALPYLGFVDLNQRTLHNNTMVGGLALLSLAWLGVNALVSQPLLRQARSTVLWFYGALALAAMVLRVFLGDVAPNPDWLRDYLDYLGPLLMLLALIFTTYHSRSWVPAAMAVAIAVILFPEMRANLQRTFPTLVWGSGLTSASVSLALMFLCFHLRRSPALQRLGEGDLFFGRDPFPFRRLDHTLFTGPILVAALYLAIKVDTWNLARNWSSEGLAVKTAVALILTGVTWVLAAVYQRAKSGAKGLVYLGYGWGALGITCGYWRLAEHPHWSWPLLLIGLTLQALYWTFRHGLEPRQPWARLLLTEPAFNLLHAGGLVLLAVSLGMLGAGADLERTKWLLLFLAAQGVWHGLARRQPAFGVLLFFLLWLCLLAFTAPGTGPLWERLSVPRSLPPTLWMLLSIQVLMLPFEQRKTLHGQLKPLIEPMFLLASVATTGLALWGAAESVGSTWFPPRLLWLLLATLLLTARAHGSGPLLLLGLWLSYELIQLGELRSLSWTGDRLRLLLMPWRLAVFGLALALLSQAGRWLRARWPSLLVGPFARPLLATPAGPWVYRTAVGLVCLAACYHTVRSDYRNSTLQLWTPYVGAAACAVVAWCWRRTRYWAMASVLLALANLHLVRVFAGPWLRVHGLSELHLACLGLGLSLALTSLVRLKLRQPAAVAALNQGSLALAGLILVLLTVNYLSQPNLEAISSWRFIISGVLALMAGGYFRRAARHPGPGEEPHVELAEACYHFGLVLAIWCAALLIPWLRQPVLALAALSLPVVFFYLRAEWGARAGESAARRYRNSAAVLGFVIMALYLFRGAFHLVAFPDQPIATDYYHHNAALIMVLSLILLRLHGLGGTWWLAFYGGLGLMGGSYFLLTALPGLSPFVAPMPAAWCAIGLAHFWVLVSHNRSPLRTAMQQLAALDDAAWHGLRRLWGGCLQVAVHAALLWGLADYASDSQMVAPLLAGTASVLIHQGIIRRSRFYLVLAAVELVLALHMDFLVPSWLMRAQVIWALLIIWGTARALHELKREWVAGFLGVIAACLGFLVFGHILHHGPYTPVGLWAMTLLALFVALHPVETCPSSRGGERASAWLLLVVPVWLVYFSQVPLTGKGVAGALATWPIVAVLATLFLTGAAAARFQVRWAAPYRACPRSRFFLADELLCGLERHGERIHLATLWLDFAGAAALVVLHYRQAYAPREWMVLTALYTGMAVAWLVQSRRRPSLMASYLMQLCVLGTFAVVRRQLMLSTDFWNYEYDVWTSLAVSFLLTGARRAFEQQPRPMHLSLVTSLCVLPVIGFVWVLVHGLGPDLALLVVGLHSLMFAYLGKDDRESPFNLVAVGGFVGFVLLAFWTKLEFRAVHAYVIPVGLGMLVLLHLLRDRVEPATRNAVRLITLLAMLGSSGYYALLDPRHPVTFNFTLILLCLLAMVLGSLLRVRLYLALGFTGLVVALISLLTRILIHADRSVRNIAIGSLVLGIGVALVFGAIYYKANRDKLDARFRRWQERFGSWE